MLILVPIVYSENDERRAFLYKVSARTRSSIEGIEINQDSELVKYQELVKTLVGPESHIEILISPIDNTVRRIEKIHPDNMASMTLGIFLAIENQINNRHFKQNYDYVVVTGDIAGNCLKTIGDEDKKLEALKLYMAKEENKTKKAQFIYVKNEITLKPGLNTEKTIETIRIHGNTSYSAFMNTVFSRTGDTVEYFANFVEKNGLPHGIGKISYLEVQKRSASYKFVYSNNRLIRVEYINSKGNPYAHSLSINHPIIQDIYYPDDKTIKIHCKTRAGKTEYIKEYKPYHDGFNRVNFMSPDESCGFYLNKNTLDDYSPVSANTSFTKAQIRGFLLERDNEGAITKKKYVRFQNSKEFQSDENGIYGFEFVNDERGLPIYEFYIDKNDNRTETSRGIGGSRFFYDDKGEVIERDFIDSNGNLVNQKGICKILYKRNSDGNITEDIYFDKEGNKVVSPEGYHKAIYRYEEGHNAEVLFQDKYGKAAVSIYGFSKVINTYNDQGYKTRESLFDKRGNPCYGVIDENYFSVRELVYDLRGNITENRFYDTEGNSYKGNSGSEVIKHEYDTNGNIIEDSYCDSADNLQEDDNGIAKVQSMYDEFGRKIAEYNYGRDEKLKKIKPGFAISKMTYDEETGNISSISFYDENNNPVVTDYGYFKREIEYYECGLTKEIRLYNSENSLIDGTCVQTFSYDNQGELVEWRNLNKDNQLEEDFFGFAVTRHYKENEKDCYEWFDNENNFIKRIEYLYDKRGNCIKTRILEGERLEFAECENRIYDEKGNVLEISYTNENDSALVNNPSGYAKVINKFDCRGNIVERYKYTKDGDLFEEQKGVYGYKYSYDERNRPVKCVALGKNRIEKTDNPCVVSEYNIRYLSEKECVFIAVNIKNEVIIDKKAQYSIHRQADLIEYEFLDDSVTISSIITHE